jgi:hypothetical protein
VTKTPRSSDWHISGWPAAVLAPLLLPIALLLRILPIKQTRDRTAEEVAGFLRDFINHTGGAWDWDDFTSVPITAPELEALRAEACEIELPIDEVGLGKLRELLEKSEKLAKHRSDLS